MGGRHAGSPGVVTETVEPPDRRLRLGWKERASKARMVALVTLAALGVAIVLVVLLASIPGRQIEWLHGVDPPRVVIEAKTNAVAFRVSEITNLVRSARPDFGVVLAGDQQGGHRLAGFAGLRLDPPLERPAAWRALGGDSVVAELERGDPVGLVRHLEVTPACGVRIESGIGTRIRLNIFSIEDGSVGGGTGQPCMIHGDLLPLKADTTGFPDHLPYHDTVHVDRPATLSLSGEGPLRLRRVSLQALGFVTRGQSGLREALIHLPEYGLEGDRARRAYHGDHLLLAGVQGELMELVVKDEGLEMVFNGSIEEGWLRGEPLRPNALRTLVHERTYVLVGSLFLGILSLMTAVVRLWS